MAVDCHMSSYASVGGIIARARGAWKPPPKLSLSQWAEANFFLSAENAAEPGRWHCIPYQVEMMDAFTDPRVSQISVMKSARVGLTKIFNAFVGYCMDRAPCPVLVVQPTVEDAKGYSKEEIAPMLRDCPVLTKIVFDDAEENGPKDSGNTILHKTFPGGVLSLVGANSGTGLRRVSRRVVLFDEVDAYPPSAGSDGDPIKLGIKRTEYYWDRKIGACSTPLTAGASRIEKLFDAGDGRRYFVPCPHCGHMAPLVFSGEHGHAMTWPEGQPQDAFFTCQANGCVIEHKDKRAMVQGGKWRASRPFRGHASFHIWAGYSFAPNATWQQIAEEFVAAKSDPQQLKVFVNTVLGETWKERGEAPDWERLYQRRERYEIGTVPAESLVVTCGVDVQKDRWVYEVVSWGAGKESWSVDAGIIPGDTSNAAEWTKVDELLSRTYPGPAGADVAIRYLAVDSGYNTNTVYNWARRHPLSRVIAVKGSATARTLIGAPTAVDVNVNGKRLARGYKVWTVGADIAKAELYGWLGLRAPKDGAPYPPGYCHFPEYGEDFFKQITAEHLVSHVNGRGFTVHEWQLQPGRENHWLDCRVYARAAAVLVGLDRMRAPTRSFPPPRLPLAVVMAVNRDTPGEPMDRDEDYAAATERWEKERERKPKKGGGFLGNRGKGWLR